MPPQQGRPPVADSSFLQCLDPAEPVLRRALLVTLGPALSVLAEARSEYGNPLPLSSRPSALRFRFVPGTKRRSVAALPNNGVFRTSQLQLEKPAARAASRFSRKVRALSLGCAPHGRADPPRDLGVSSGSDKSPPYRLPLSAARIRVAINSPIFFPRANQDF